MAATKAELESDWNQYHRLQQLAKETIAAGRYADAIRLAVDAWPFIDGMMQFGRRFKSIEFETVDAIELVLNYAPALFDIDALDRLEELLTRQKRIDRLAAEDLAQRLLEARAALQCAYRLWSAIEDHGTLNRSAFLAIWTASEKQLHAVADAWVRMNVITLVGNSESSGLSFTTRMDLTTHGKCETCGAVAKAPKAKFLEEQKCPRCNKISGFVILEPVALAEAKQ
jgi:hypothetical protein